MKGMLQDVLDELVSIRTSTARISEILSTLERLLADICSQLNAEAADRLRIFVSLQDSFECNGVLLRMELGSMKVALIVFSAFADSHMDVCILLAS
ncbi:hypothetical protein AcV5_001266 [Taiwanofungus camphoratus]|nr:hypothetical protein AcV5_001266 [Antrodia cinnamomea]KAI0941393.1 hypothetical protein AcV7_002983 [Antrodia cinnamomea]